MEKLVSTNEAAKILGLSLQGIHYRIRSGRLKSKKKDNKTFVYIENEVANKDEVKDKENNINDLLIIKDEQILFLKKSLKWMKKHYRDEMNRLEKNQDKIVKVFQSEINLLQLAFNEMRNIYKLDNKSNQKVSKSDNNTIEFGMMDIKDFFIFMKKSNKSDSQIKSIILDRIKQGDKRFIFNRQTKEVMIYKSDFVDLI